MLFKKKLTKKVLCKVWDLGKDAVRHFKSLLIFSVKSKNVLSSNSKLVRCLERNKIPN